MNRQLPPGGRPGSTAGADARRHGADCLAVVRERLVSLIEKESLAVYRKGRDGLAVKERAYAGQVLGQLGDRRPGVGVMNGLPDIDWIKIPAGKFLMGGEGDWDGDGVGEYVCDVLKAPYRIGRYPITVAQYQEFVKANGYQESRFWTKAGWEWRTRRKISGPEDEDDPIFQTLNHTRVGVSWYEAVAFCGWLSHRLGRDIRLPSEAQWERAARGKKGRPYPWGDAKIFDERCNCSLSRTSAVGLFPLGHAECGGADFAGNVLEWCRSLRGHWREAEFGYPYRPDDGRENPEAPEDHTRVLRGTSWRFDQPRHLLSSYRRDLYPDYRGFSIGFRVVWVGVSAR